MIDVKDSCGLSNGAIAYHICISGLRQRMGQPHGIYMMKEKLVNDCHFCNGHSRVYLYRWNSNWDHIAEDLWLVRQRYEVPLLIGVYAYSWGAGWGAMELARALQKFGVPIYKMVLCDPIYRHPRFILRWLSLLKRKHLFFGPPLIRVPKGVNEVFQLRQEINRPQGHHLIYESDSTKRHRPILLDVCHEKADNHKKFHELVLEVANDIREKIGHPRCLQSLSPDNKNCSKI